MSTKYSYFSLPPGTQTIRLLQLQPAASDAHPLQASHCPCSIPTLSDSSKVEQPLGTRRVRPGTRMETCSRSGVKSCLQHQRQVISKAVRA